MKFLHYNETYEAQFWTNPLFYRITVFSKNGFSPLTADDGFSGHGYCEIWKPLLKGVLYFLNFTRDRVRFKEKTQNFSEQGYTG